MGNLYNQWNFTTNVQGNQLTANTDIAMFYCPTRRNTVRPGDETMLLPNPTGATVLWKFGGTDYGGCAGRIVGWDSAPDPSTTPPTYWHKYVDPKTPDTTTSTTDPFYKSFYQTVAPYQITLANDNSAKRIGIFQRINTPTTFAAVARDGLSNTIMIGELQRITQQPSPTGVTPVIVGPSHDGWAVGGDATLFSTAINNPPPDPTASPPVVAGPVINNLDFRSPGSDHVTGAHFGLADGSVETDFQLGRSERFCVDGQFRRQHAHSTAGIARWCRTCGAGVLLMLRG